MLKEVCKTILVVFFENSTNGLRDMELSTLFRIFIVTDVISQTILQLTHAHCRINRQWLWLLRYRYERQRQHNSAQNKLFHIHKFWLIFYKLLQLLFSSTLFSAISSWLLVSGS